MRARSLLWDDEAAPPTRSLGTADARWGARSVRLIVRESGAAGLASANARGARRMIAVAQVPSEPPAEFASRVVRRILALELSRQHIERTVLHLSPQARPERAAARLVIVRALITHTVSAPADASHIVLCTDGERLGPLQLGLPALLEALRADAGHRTVTVATRRGPEPPLTQNPALAGG